MKHHNEIIPKMQPKKKGTIILVIALCSLAAYAVWLALQPLDSTREHRQHRSIEYYQHKPQQENDKNAR